MLYGKLLRFTYRLERNPVFASVKRGLLLLTPVLIVGAVALMLRNLPIPGFQEWITAAAGGAVYSTLGFIYDATIGIMSLCLLCGISYSYAATISGSDKTFCLVAVMASLGSFFILFSAQSSGVFEFASLGAVSMFGAILCSVTATALFGAFNDIIKTLFAESLGNASGFLVGGLNGCGWKSFYMILPYALAGMAICLFLPSKMNILMLGDETANSLGLRTELFRFILIAVSSLLSGAAIAAVGMLSFVGLIVPHIARLLVGSDHRFLFPASTLLGFSLIVICDTVGRVIMPPGEVPVSIIISFIGAPFFLFLLRSRGKGGD